jgi:hypothetical protein
MNCPLCSNKDNRHEDLDHEFVLNTVYWYLYKRDLDRESFNLIGQSSAGEYYVAKNYITTNRVNLNLKYLDIKDAPQLLIKINKLKLYL